MRNFYLATFFSIFFLHGLMQAQCPPPGTPTSTNTCPEALPNCLNLDGYCGTINNNNVSQTFPGCNNNVLNNDEWFAFYAGTTSIGIAITPSNCNAGGNQGLQGAIYAGCGPPWVAMDLQCACTTNTFILNSSNFVVGQIYWIVIDGCAGNVCDYAVEVVTGSTVAEAPDNPGTVTGPTTVCQNSSSTYTVPPVPGATAYQWSMSPQLGTFTSTTNSVNVNWTTPGTAQLCVTSSNQCFANNTPSCITVEVLPPPTAVISGSGVICTAGGGTFPITVTFTGGDGPWTFVYRINGVNQPPITTTDNPYTINASQTGTYTLLSVVYPNSTCFGTVSGSANVDQANILVTGNVTPETCGNGTGAVNITPVPVGTYTYTWSNSSTSEDLTDVNAGTYSVTVSNAEGCTSTGSFTVPNNSVPINISGSPIANTTCDVDNGQINISIAPANTYEIEWSNGATSEDITGLAPGTYTVTVTLGNTCTGSASFTVPDQPNNPTASSSATPSTCEQDNADVNLSVSGGVAPYSFLWSNGETTEDLNDVAAGSYTVTVTGDNGCTDTETLTVLNNNPPIAVTGNPLSSTSCGAGNGSINITVTPGTPSGGGNYTFVWSNGETTEDVTDLGPGSYTVTVTGNGACTGSNTFTILEQLVNPSLNASNTPSTCGLANGDINLTVAGATTPYTFEWSNGETTEDLNDVVAGTYQVTVTAANGCTSTTSVNLANNDLNVVITPTILPNTECTGGNGSISIAISPPSNYTIEWFDGSTGTSVANLEAGSYSVTVSAGGTCTPSRVRPRPAAPGPARP
ncbi:MAG: hypothetical protein MUC59_14315 [Saprospiraceae bacterium]|nr:hypothetical protein [Saprospiraceae bacterium]